MILKKYFLWLISISLLFGCQSGINTENNQDNQIKNCGLNSDYQPLIDVKSREDFFRLFDFYIQAIIKQSDRLIFQTKNHDLVFCQGNQSFSIQPSTRQFSPEKTYQQLLEELSNPPYENITLNEQNYQYRVSNESTQQNKQIEVLWWPGNQESGDEGRYEIKYDLGTNLKLAEGFSSWQEIYGDEYSKPSWKAPVYWVGKDWYWRNGKFQRGFDSLPLNAFGGGFSGITIPSENYTFPLNSASIRGDLDLINISLSSTEIKYYSAWVDSKLLTPYLTLIPAPKFDQTKPNPL